MFEKNFDIKKREIRVIIESLSSNLWFDLLMFDNNREIFQFYKLENKKNKFGLDKILCGTETFGIYSGEKKTNNVNRNNKTLNNNHLNFLLDEYINTRKSFEISNFSQFQYSEEIWLSIDTWFSKNIKNQLFEETPIILFILQETLRIDLLMEIYSRMKLFEETIGTSINTENSFLTTETLKNLIYLNYFPLSRDKINSYSLYEICGRKNNFSIKLKNFWSRGKVRLKSLKKNLSSNINRPVTQNLNPTEPNCWMNGVLNKNIYWTKSFLHDTIRLLEIFCSQEMNREILNLGTILKNMKKMHEPETQLSFLRTVITDQKGDFLLKYATIISNSLNQYGTHRLWKNKFITPKINKISNWGKFMAGSIYFSRYNGNRSLLMVMNELLKNKHISDYLKGGLIVNTAIIVSQLTNYERVFINKLNLILNQNSSLPIRYGVLLGISLFSIENWKNFELSEIYRSMRDSVYIEKISNLTSFIGLGIILKGRPVKKFVKILFNIICEKVSGVNSIFLSFSLGFIFFETGYKACSIFDSLIKEKNIAIRCAAINILSFAFIGTSNINILRKLIRNFMLETQSSVKQIFVLGFGIIFKSNLEKITWLFEELIMNHDPFVRFSTTFSILLCFSENPKNCRASKELLIKLTFDQSDFVRQAACITLGLIGRNGLKKKYIDFGIRRFRDIISNREETEITKFGAFIGASLIESSASKIGPENLTNYETSNEFVKMILGITYWYNINNIVFFVHS